MKQFDLYDKVLVTPKHGEGEVVGCVVGFETRETKDGVVCDIEYGSQVDPQEHSYMVLIGQFTFKCDPMLVEFPESEIKAFPEV